MLQPRYLLLTTPVVAGLIGHRWFGGCRRTGCAGWNIARERDRGASERGVTLAVGKGLESVPGDNAGISAIRGAKIRNKASYTCFKS